MDLSKHLASYEKKIRILKETIYAVTEYDSPLYAVLVCGSAGIGKTYTINGILQARAEDDTKPIIYRKISGKISVRALWEHLYENSTYEHVLFFDDADFILTDLHCLGMLKEATDTNCNRVINWRISRRATNSTTESHTVFDGKLVIATNINVKSTPHLDAVRDRFEVYDIKVTFYEKLAKIQEIANNPHGSPLMKISLEGNKDLLKVLISNQECFGEELSLRTFIGLQRMYRLFPSNWKEHAEEKFLKK